MAITTLDGAISNSKFPIFFSKPAVSGTHVAGRPVTNLYTLGYPNAGSAPTPGIGGAALTSYAGQLPFSNPLSGYTYLRAFEANNTSVGMLLLCDRLWHNSGITITSTSEQTFTGAAQIPARDINGTNSGIGVYAGVEVSGVTGSGTPTLTLKYTNSGGTADKTATNIQPTATSTPAGTFYQIGLAAGDVGVQKAQSLTLSSTWTSGTIHVVLYRVLCILPFRYQYLESMKDMLTTGFTRLYDNTVPFLIFLPNSSAASAVSGKLQFAQG